MSINSLSKNINSFVFSLNKTNAVIDIQRIINSAIFFFLFLLMNSLQATCDFPRVADYSKLFTDDLVNILGLSTLCKEYVRRIVPESWDSSEVQELVWPPGELRGTVHLQLTLVPSLNASGPLAPHLSFPSIAWTALMDNDEIIHVCELLLC